MLMCLGQDSFMGGGGQSSGPGLGIANALKILWDEIALALLPPPPPGGGEGPPGGGEKESFPEDFKTQALTDAAKAGLCGLHVIICPLSKQSRDPSPDPPRPPGWQPKKGREGVFS